jgi:type I restriction enzyme S subunit
MREQRKRALLPKLRFPEFRDAGEWEEKSLKSICVMQAGKFVVAADILERGKGGVYPCYGGNGLRGYTKTHTHSGRYPLIGRQGALCGNVTLVSGQFHATEHAIVVTPKNGINVDWLYYTLDLLKLNRFATGQAQPGLSVEVLDKVSSVVPQEIEQQKIADCLSSIDELITAGAQKLDTLKAHKKGLMQQLFPAEGETLPKLRFPEFLDAGEWKEKLIEDFFVVGSSKRVLQQDWTTQGVPFYRTRELVSLNKNEPFGSEIYISEELFREISEKYGLPTEGDFLVSGVGTLGISYQVQAKDRFYFKDGNVLWFKLKDGIVSTFFKYCFEADGIQNQILGQASISTVGTYTIQNAKATKFCCPPNIEEQQKIADCLSSIDDLITAQTQKLAALKDHKKGLMQQLFPSVGGVDGEAGRGGRPVVDEAQE